MKTAGNRASQSDPPTEDVAGRPAPKPLLSVIMPTYQGERWIEEALESLVAATRERPTVGGGAESGFEVIVVDDRSEDRTRERALSFVDRLDLQLFERRGSRNWVQGTREGFARARGEFVCFLHQDDLWLPGRWSGICRCLSDDRSPDFLLTDAHFLDVRGERLGPWRCPLPAVKTAPGSGEAGAVEAGRFRRRLCVQNFLAIAAPVFRRSLLGAEDLLDPALWYTADWDLWFRLGERARKIAYLPRATVGFRVHAESQTVRRSLESDTFRWQLETALERYLDPRDPPSVERAARLSLEVNLALARRIHGLPRESGLVRRGLRAGPSGWRRFLLHSRIFERVLARMRGKFRGRF